MKTLRVTLADIAGPTGATGGSTAVVTARYVDTRYRGRDVHLTDGSIVVPVRRTTPADDGPPEAWEFDVYANDVAPVREVDYGFLVEIAWTVTAPEGGKSSGARRVEITDAMDATVQLGLLATPEPIGNPTASASFAASVLAAVENRVRHDAAQGLTEPQQAQARDNIGLGTAATTDAADYATAAQGAKADAALLLSSTRPTVLLVGDSITAQCGTPDRLNVADAYAARGFFNWANWLMGERYAVVNVAGIGGQTSAQMAARIVADMAANPSEWVVLEAGPNDVGQDRTYADIVASLTSCLDSIQAAGRRCCILTIWPSNSYTTTARRQIAGQVSQWIAALPLTRPGVVVADVYSALVDPATGMLGAGMTYDTVHPGSAAAYRAGVKVAAAMSPFAPPLPNLRLADVSTSTAIGNPSFLTNGAGWTLSIGTGATYPRNPDGFGNMATATVAATGVQFTYEENLASGRVAIGDTIQMRARIRWSGLTWSGTMTRYAPWLTVLARSTTGGFSSTFYVSAGSEPSFAHATFGASDVSTSGDVIITSTKGTVPATAADAGAINRLYAQFGFASTNLTGGTVTVSDVSVYKV